MAARKGTARKKATSAAKKVLVIFILSSLFPALIHADGPLISRVI